MIKKIFYVILIVVTFIIASPFLVHAAEENKVPTKPVNWWTNLQPATVKCWSPQGNGDHYGAFNNICESENAEYTFQEFMNRLWNNGYQYNIVTELIDGGYGEFLDPGFFSWFITSRPGSARDNKYAPSIPDPPINQNVQVDLFIPSQTSTAYKDNYYWSLEPHLGQNSDGTYYLDYYQAKILQLSYESGTGYYRKMWFNQILTSSIDPVDDIAKTYTNYNIYYKSGSMVQPGNLFYAMTYGTDQDIIKPVPDPTPVPTPDYSGELGDINDSLDDLNDAITDPSSPNLDGLGDSSGWLPPGPVDSIINLPLSLFNNINDNLSKSCQPVNLPLPFVDKTIQLPCLNTIYEQIDGLSDWINTIGTIAAAFILYNYFIKLYQWVDDTLNFRENTWQDWGGV